MVCATIPTIEYCLILFPENPDFYYLIFKILEAITFYLMPLTIQLTSYAFVSKHLFYGFGSALQTGLTQLYFAPVVCGEFVLDRRFVMKYFVT